jgi:hypothetical protein
VTVPGLNAGTLNAEMLDRPEAFGRALAKHIGRSLTRQRPMAGRRKAP